MEPSLDEAGGGKEEEEKQVADINILAAALHFRLQPPQLLFHPVADSADHADQSPSAESAHRFCFIRRGSMERLPLHDLPSWNQSHQDNPQLPILHDSAVDRFENPSCYDFSLIQEIPQTFKQVKKGEVSGGNSQPHAN